MKRLNRESRIWHDMAVYNTTENAYKAREHGNG